MTAFGDLIREWRTIRRFSQLDLSLEAEMSARHLSFLESGRSQPSRAMALKLSTALGMPRAVANQALKAAGFTPSYPQLTEDAPDMAPIRAAIDMMLANHAPFPAVALDSAWNVIAANAPMGALFSEIGLGAAGNMLEALIALEETGVIENWEETATLTLARLRTEIAEAGGAPELEAMAKRLAARPRLQAADPGAVDLNRAVIPSVFVLGDRRLALFSAIAQFGAVQEVTASEIRLEMFLPADVATRRFFEGAEA